MPTYEYRPSGSIPGLTAQTVGEELERIRLAHDGRLTPPAIVRAATPKSSPLHVAFEWDNATAGKAWREHQARNIVRSVRVVYSETESGPAYVNVRTAEPAEDEPRSYYQSTEVAVRNVSEWDSAVDALAVKLRGAQQAIDDLQRLAGQQQDDGRAVAVATIARAFALIDSSLAAIRH